MKRFSTKTIIVSFFVVAFLCIAFVVTATYRNMMQTKLQSSKVDISLQFLLAAETLENKLHDLDIAQRGYIFSSREKFAAAYKNAFDNLITDTNSLRKLEVLAPGRKPEIDNLNHLIINKADDSRQTISLFDNGGNYQAVFDRINKGIGKQISDSLILLIQQVENKDRDVLKKSNIYLGNIAQKTTFRFFLLAFIFFIILFVFSFIIYHDFVKREAAAIRLRYQASLIDTIPDAIFTTDKNFIINSWNKYAGEMYGVTTAAAIGKPTHELFTVHHTAQQNVSSLSELQTTGSFKQEYSITKKTGETIFVLASLNTIVNNHGEITGYVAVHRDITERKTLEKELKNFNTELAEQVKDKTAETTNLLERITDGFLALDSNFTFTFVNKKAGEILGHKPEDMIGKNILSGFSVIASSQFNDACLQCFQTQQYTFLENQYTPLNIWIENDIYPSPDGLSVFFKDATFKKKAELALKESEGHYRHLIEHIHAGVVVHRPDSSILLCNQEATRLLGLSVDQMMGKTAIDPEWNFVSGDGKKMDADQYPVIQVIASGKPLLNMIGGIDNPNNKGRVWVLINAFPEYDTTGELEQVVVTFVDITDRKKAEEELKRSEETLNMAQGIAKIGSWEFDLNTHDLRWSKELYRIFEIENLNGSELYDAYRKKFHPEDLYKLDDMINYAITNNKGFTYQHRIIANDKSIKHILGIGEVTLNENGNIIGLKGTGQDITELIKAEEKLQKSYQHIRQLVNHLQDIREQERTNIAREIHDELGQQLTGLKMYISWLNKKITRKETEIQDKFTATLELIEETIKSVRKISTDLRPSMLDDLGLLAALEWQSHEFEKRSGIVTEFINLTGNKEIPAKLKTGLFRIFQESLTNVARHANAKKIIASLKFDNNNLTLTITDDGKGFTIKNIESKKTLGLFGMKERTMEMGGKYEIKSEPGKGTTVSIIVPF